MQLIENNSLFYQITKHQNQFNTSYSYNYSQSIILQNQILNTHHPFKIISQTSQKLFGFCGPFIKLLYNKQSNIFTCRLLLLINNQIVILKNQFQITYLIRYFLKINVLYQNYIFSIHPQSGQLCFQVNFAAILQCQSSSNNVQYPQFMENINFQLKFKIPKILNIIQYILHKFPNLRKKQDCIQDQNKCQQCSKNSLIKAKLLTLKKYIVHSSLYTWNLLTSSTSRQSKQNVYQQLKHKYKLSKKFINFNEKIKNITKIYEDVLTKYQLQYKQMTAEQDNQILFNYYIKNVNINHSQKMIINLKFPTDLLKIINIKQQFKINSKSGTHNAFIHKFSKSQKQRIQNHHQVISKLPNQEFPWIAKYFIPTNLKIETQLYIFTNLNNSQIYCNYLQNNSKSISIFTKIHLLYQIIVSLQYLRDHKIIYNNLSHKNLYIKKNLDIKLFDFRNSHHQASDLSKIQFKNAFPYFYKFMSPLSSLYCKINEQQRCDVASFNLLMYSTLFNNQLIKIKDSRLLLLNKKGYFQQYNLSLLKKCSIEMPQTYGDQIFILLQLLILKGYTLPTQYKNFQSRPYMDWMVIIMRYTLIYFHAHL